MLQISNCTIKSDNPDMLVRRIGNTEAFSAMTLRYGDTADKYQEIPAAEYRAARAEAEKKAEYDAAYTRRVEQYIAERYSLSAELAVINNYNGLALMADADADTVARRTREYNSYQAYRSECKARARAELAVEMATNDSETSN